jgi:hypothetical protein
MVSPAVMSLKSQMRHKTFNCRAMIMAYAKLALLHKRRKASKMPTGLPGAMGLPEFSVCVSILTLRAAQMFAAFVDHIAFACFGASFRDTVLLGFALRVTHDSMSYMVEDRVNGTMVKGAGSSHWGKSNHELGLSRSTMPDGSNL